MKRFLVVLIVMFFSLSATVVKVQGQGQGNCLDPNTPGFIKEDTGGTSVTITADSGYVITSVTVKAGSDQSSDSYCTTYTANGTYSCYTVTGLGTGSVTVTKIGEGQNCKDISHLEAIQVLPTLTPTDPTPTETVTEIPTETEEPSQTPTETVTEVPTEDPFETPTVTITEDPTPEGTPTPIPTLPPPEITGTPQVLLPVTGGDLSKGSNMWMVVIGIAMLSWGAFALLREKFTK